MSTFFITAIDTDAGKTITTGLLAAYMKSLGLDITTMKLAQTGCVNISDDITTHRFLMSEPLSNDDVNGASCSYLFKFPASRITSYNVCYTKLLRPGLQMVFSVDVS